MKFNTAKSEAIQFQLAPMIDVVFLLLCFWVVMSLFSQWESEVSIVLPTSTSSETNSRFRGEIIINVFEDGQYVVNGRTLDSEALGQVLLRISELFPGQPVVVRGDKLANFEYVMEVLDLCREADIYNISFATQVAE
jgi:biopolymer transport protein ExbD